MVVVIVEERVRRLGVFPVLMPSGSGTERDCSVLSQCPIHPSIHPPSVSPPLRSILHPPSSVIRPPSSVSVVSLYPLPGPQHWSSSQSSQAAKAAKASKHSSIQASIPNLPWSQVLPTHPLPVECRTILPSLHLPSFHLPPPPVEQAALVTATFLKPILHLRGSWDKKGPVPYRDDLLDHKHKHHKLHIHEHPPQSLTTSTYAFTARASSLFFIPFCSLNIRTSGHQKIIVIS